MRPLRDLKNQIISVVESEVLSKFDRALHLTGVICYGSRVSGGARKNSDLDMMVIVKPQDGSEFYGEFHGTLRLDNEPLPVELRIYSFGRLQKLLTGEDPKRLFALNQSFVLLDKENLLEGFKSAASERYLELIREFSTELHSLNPNEILPVLQMAASEQLTIAQHLFEKKQTVAAFLCFFEFLIDYLVCVEGCLQSISGEKNSFDNERCVSNLYFLRSEKGGRFFNIDKYPWPKRYQELLGEINASLTLSQGSLVLAFSLLDKHFYSLFHKPLIVTGDQWPSVSFT